MTSQTLFFFLADWSQWESILDSAVICNTPASPNTIKHPCNINTKQVTEIGYRDTDLDVWEPAWNEWHQPSANRKEQTRRERAACFSGRTEWVAPTQDGIREQEHRVPGTWASCPIWVGETAWVTTSATLETLRSVLSKRCVRHGDDN